MNPIEKDLRSYFGITSESNILEHYGTKRHSGRYPWGSGDNPYQHSGDFLSRVEELKRRASRRRRSWRPSTTLSLTSIRWA